MINITGITENKILTRKAVEVINKKLEGRKLTQQDSNYLSRFVRPKLKDIASINVEVLLKKLEYNPKARAIEKKIKRIILENVPRVDSIIVCGSAIQTNYKGYNDIDIIVATKKIIAKKLKERWELIEKVRKIGKRENLNLDVQIYAKKSILLQYPHSPSLIYQLKDSKIIYGNLKVPKKTKLSNLDLRMKLDWSEGLDINSDPNEIYYALRNAILVSLLMNKRVDNYQLNEELKNTLGNDLIDNLRKNSSSHIQRKIALGYLRMIVKKLRSELIKNEQK